MYGWMQMQFICRLEPTEALNSVNVSVVCRKQDYGDRKKMMEDSNLPTLHLN